MLQFLLLMILFQQHYALDTAIDGEMRCECHLIVNSFGRVRDNMAGIIENKTKVIPGTRSFHPIFIPRTTLIELLVKLHWLVFIPISVQTFLLEDRFLNVACHCQTWELIAEDF